MKANIQNTTIAESEDTTEVEGNQYFPRQDVKMGFLRKSETPYTCPWKGEAQYFHVEIDGEVYKDAAWSYPEPKDAAKHIAGYIAFDKNNVTIVK